MVEHAGMIERRRGSALSEVELVHERLETPLLPGFSLDLAAVFAR